MRKSNHHVGTSGWSYDHWKKTFYPQDFPAKDWLAFYAERFSCVELNNSFYHLPQKQTLRQWRDDVPKNFLFTAKASRYITHMKKLNNPRQSLRMFFQRVDVLGDKLGPILFQLPPRWRFNEERLEEFLKSLSKDYRYTFEFRDHSWLNERTCELLEKAGAAFCIYDLNGFQTDRTVTTDFVYIRLHGPDGAYKGDYSHQRLSTWAKHIKQWLKARKTVYCFFDNDQSGFATKNAGQLQTLLQ
jgi:uncharacterized protein YecE (DUF72 family)